VATAAEFADCEFVVAAAAVVGGSAVGRMGWSMSSPANWEKMRAANGQLKC
jgi:hypothetical protein